MKRSTRTLLILFFTGVATVSGIVLATGALNKDNTSPNTAVPNHPSLTVEIVHPHQVTWPRRLTASGALAAWQEATISAEVGGLQIVSMHVDVGSRVKKGQLLAELNSESLKVELRKAQAAVALERASLREAQSNVRRARVVKGSGALSGQKIEQYEVAEQSARANLASAEASVAATQIQLKQTRILAVDDGIISARTATLGAVVSVGSELFRIVRKERIEWLAEINADQLGGLRQGQKATVTLPGGTTVEGTIRQLASTLDSKNRVAYAYVQLPVQPDVRAGAYVTGYIDLGQQEALTVPSSAIVLRDGNSYVFEVDQEHQSVRQRKVRIGRMQDNAVEVIDGLDQTASLVQSGGVFLNDGDTVRISNKSAKI